MKHPIRAVAALAILVFTLGINGGNCFTYYDVEVLIPPGQDMDRATVLIFNMKTGKKALLDWEEFLKMDSIDDLH